MRKIARRMVTIWICRECGNYYASSNAGNLADKWNKDRRTGQRTFPRSRCPTRECAEQGIDREPVNVYI